MSVPGACTATYGLLTRAALAATAVPGKSLIGALQPSNTTSCHSSASCTAALQSRLFSAAPALSQFRPRKAPIEITDAAASRIKELLDKRKKEYLKVGVRKRGCNGLSYTMNYADSKGRFDEVVEAKGVKIVIDAGAVMYILGTTMDFINDRLKSEFVFINPNSKGSCGCGESFTT